MDADELDRRHWLVIDLVKQAVDGITGAGLTVLEVGPGTGKVGFRLGWNFAVDFLDVDPYLLDAIKGKAPLSCGIEADIAQWISRVRWDVVVACEVIEHIHDWKAAVRNMMAAARRRVILTTPVGYSYYDLGHKRPYTIKDFAWLRQEPGWKVNLMATITKEEDLDLDQMCFVVVLDRRI